MFTDCEVHGYMKPNTENVGWSGQLLYADRVSSSGLRGLLPLVKLNPWDLPASPWLTVLQDTAAPRLGVADINFAATPQQIPMCVANLQRRISDYFF